MKKSDLLDSIVDTQAKIGQHHRRIAKLEFKIKHYELVISKLLNRDSKICSRPSPVLFRLTVSYNWVKSVPDQNLSSNASAPFSAAANAMRLRKIIIQDDTDAASRISITIFTIQLASRINCQTCKSFCIFDLRPDPFGHACWFEVVCP